MPIFSVLPFGSGFGAKRRPIYPAGMDSTAVALLAQEIVAAGGAPRPFHTLSLIYSKLPNLSREAPYVERVLGNEPPWVAHRIPADDLLDFDSFVDPPVHEEPYAGLWRMGLDGITVNVAVEVGTQTMLTGIGADEMLDSQPFHIAAMLRRGQLIRAWKEAVRWARSDGCNAWDILQVFGINILRPFSGTRSLFKRSGTRLSPEDDWSVSPWIQPSFARRYSLRARAIEAFTETYGRTRNTGLSFALHSIESRVGDVNRWAVAAPLGMAIAHPFLDLRLLRLGLGIAARIIPEPGPMKCLLSTSMSAILPTEIRTRRRKGQFNEIYYLGLSRNHEYLENMVRTAPIDGLDLINKEVLIARLQEARMGMAHVRQLHRLNLTLSLVKWLCMHQHWQYARGSAVTLYSELSPNVP